MGYILANENYLIDTNTWQFIHKGYVAPFSCEVPLPYWKWGNKILHKQLVGLGKFNEFRCISDLKLNNLDVVVGRKSHLDFKFVGKRGLVNISLNWWFKMWGDSTFGPAILDRVEFSLSINDVHRRQISTPTGLGRELDESTKSNFDQFSNFTMQYLIDDRKFEVFYQDKPLNGRSYALIYGPCAILLSDKLEFDSLVYLSKLHDHELYVERVAYSVNPYVVKMAVLR